MIAYTQAEWCGKQNYVHAQVFIHPASLCLLVAAFTLFTFKVIIDMYDPSGEGNGNPLQYLLPGKSHGCQEPPREIPPMTRSCGRELLSKASELNGLPRLSWASIPKPESVRFTISWLSPTPLTLTGGYSWPPFSGENQLRAIDNKSPGHERNISNQTPSVSILACLAAISRLLQLRMWLFTASQLWEAQKA